MPQNPLTVVVRRGERLESRPPSTHSFHQVRIISPFLLSPRDLFTGSAPFPGPAYTQEGTSSRVCVGRWVVVD